jgi:hypothetical protein
MPQYNPNLTCTHELPPLILWLYSPFKILDQHSPQIMTVLIVDDSRSQFKEGFDGVHFSRAEIE